MEVTTRPEGLWNSFWTRLRGRFGLKGLALLALVAILGIFCWVTVLDGFGEWDEISDILDRSARLATGTLLSDDAPLKARDFGKAGVWVGCVFGGMASILLLGLARFWMPGAALQPSKDFFIPTVPGKWVWLFVLLAVVAGMWIRAPRLDHSLWNDEEYSVRRFSHGDWVEGKPGEWKFKPVSWNDTLFECRNGNNHHLNSLLTRWSQDGWRFASGQPRTAFSETAARMPAFIAGALTLVLIFGLGLETGRAWVGVAAAWLLALHPWHVRYAAEERGYSLMLMFLCLCLLGLIRALRTDRPGDWSWFALGAAGCLLNFTGALYVIALVNLAAAVELILRQEPRRLATLAAFNLLAAIPVAIWIFPSVPQIMNVLLHDPSRYRPGVGWHWARDLFTHLIGGVHYSLPEPEVHLGTTWLAQRAGSWFYTLYVAWFFAGMFVLGAVLALFTNAATRIAVIAPLLAGMLIVVQNALSNGALLIWYLLYLLVPLVLAVPLVVGRLLSFRPALLAPALALVVAGYALATADKRDRIVRFDRQPMRQAIAGIRDNHPGSLTAVFGVSDRQTQSYDPRVRILKDATDLDRAVEDAGRMNIPLFVYFCGRTESGRRAPELMERVLDESSFQLVRTIPGLEAMFSYELWRLKEKAS